MSASVLQCLSDPCPHRRCQGAGRAWARCDAGAFPATDAAAPLLLGGQRDAVLAFDAAVQAAFPAQRWPWHVGEAGGSVFYLSALSKGGAAPCAAPR